MKIYECEIHATLQRYWWYKQMIKKKAHDLEEKDNLGRVEKKKIFFKKNIIKFSSIVFA